MRTSLVLHHRPGRASELSRTWLSRRSGGSHQAGLAETAKHLGTRRSCPQGATLRSARHGDSCIHRRRACSAFRRWGKIRLILRRYEIDGLGIALHLVDDRRYLVGRFQRCDANFIEIAGAWAGDQLRLVGSEERCDF
jgi:hypothetical protein